MMAIKINIGPTSENTSRKRFPTVPLWELTLYLKDVLRNFRWFRKSACIQTIDGQEISSTLSASPSPAPFCSIFKHPKRLDLWFGLCLGLCLRFLGCFRCHFWSAQCPPAPFCLIFGGRSPSYHQKTCPEPTNMRLDLWRKLWRRFLGCFGGHFWSTKGRGIWSFSHST